MSWRSHRLFGLLEPLRRYLDGITSEASWGQLSVEDTRTQNEVELISFESDLCELDAGTDEKTPAADHLDRLYDWISATNKSFESGKRQEIDFKKGLELFEALREKPSEAEAMAVALCGTRPAPGVKRTNHVINSLATASGQLHRALVLHSQCCRDHTARIHLNGLSFGVDDKSSRFFLFISSDSDSQTCRWQETDCELAVKTDNKTVEDSENYLCYLLRECEQFQEQLLLTLHQMAENKLVLSGKRVNSARRQDTPEISLGYLIDQQASRRFPSKHLLLSAEKAALCLNLSLALVHLDPDPWINRKWNLDSIFLAFDSKGPGGPTLDRERPYLSTRLTETEYSNCLPGSTEIGVEAAQTRMLSFAQVLMEIYLEERLYRDIHKDGERYGRLRDLIISPDVQGEVPSTVIAAVQACLEVYRSEATVKEPSKEWIYNRIILKLDENLRPWTTPIRPEPRKWESIPASHSRKRKTSLMHSDPSEVGARPTFLLNGGGPSKRHKTMTSEDWFKMVDSLNLVLSVDSENNDYQKIRVAVLDTGITPKAAEGFDIQDRMYRDFTDCPDENMRDDTGHGTSVVDLVYKMCEPAEVYVARVMEKSHATTNSVDATIVALEWAMRNNVDIICMAIGFATEVPELKSVLKKAFAANVLVFAAASNHNNMSGVVYPARWNECVFSVFSTNAGAKNSREINPTGSGKYENFAILGEDIRDSTGETRKGTSYSTAIACGLAARLLDFAKQNPVAEGTYGNLCNDLKEKAGMAKVLCGISEKDEEYHCIAPWKLLPENLRWQSDDPSEEEIQRARVSVMNRIAHYLEKF